MRAKIMKSSVAWAFLPSRILWQNPSMLSWVCGTSVPNREFFFNPVLSSMIAADTPSLSSVLTVNWKCSGCPPVSAS